MRLTSTKLLKPGEKLAVSVYTPNGSRFLSEGVAASEFIIERLKQMGIEFTYVDDERFPDVVYKALISIKTVVDSVKAYKTALESISKGKDINEDAIKDASKAIADDTKSTGIPINIINASYVIEDSLIAHAIRTAVASVATGVYLGYNFSQLCDLSLAGFIHDLGRENITAEENKEHTEKGFEILRKYRLLNLNSSIVAYQHHENFDGSGFPRGLKGLEISEFSRIVSVADYFDTLISGQKGQPMSFEKAFAEVQANSEKKFDPLMVRAFGHSVQIYNVGTMVVLNNGKQGIVVSQNPGSPLRPNIRLFSESIPEYSEEINLSQFENREIEIQKLIL